MKLLRRIKNNVSTRHVASVLALLGVVLIPALAFAIPGAGEFTAIDSPTGREQTELYNFISKICLVVFVIVCAVMFGAIMKFRRRSDDERPEAVHGNLKIEMGLLLAASVVQIVIGIKTIDVMWYVEKLPETEMTVEAIAYQWDWQFRYPDAGGFVSEDLVIPAHTNVKLEITSKDVIHSLFVPELGIKMDCVPGRFNYWWVNADGPLNQLGIDTKAKKAPSEQYVTTRPDNLPLLTVLNALNVVDEAETISQYGGLEKRVTYLAEGRKSQVGDDRYAKYDAVEYRGMCAENCGKDHYNMYFRVVAMTPESYAQWIEDQKNGGSKDVNGSELYASKCASCHAADGSGVEGQFPPLAGSEWVNEDNDENKKRHIQVVLQGLKGEISVMGKTYNGVMQPWFNVLNDAEVAAVVNHERLSWGNAGGEVDEDMVAEVRDSLGYPAFSAGGAAPVDENELFSAGRQIYAACVTCHGADGKKGSAKLAGSSMVTSDDANAYVSMLVNGTKAKSAMGRSMSDYDIAALMTYTRKSFGNSSGAVQPSKISSVREAVQK